MHMQRLSLCQISGISQKGGRFHSGAFAMENINATNPVELVPSVIPPRHELLLLEEGIEIHQTKVYGVGIDCHKMFIQVSVIVKRDFRTYEYRHEFGTDWKSLTEAREWILSVITTCSSPPVEQIPDSHTLHYVIESTSTYHMPVVSALGGKPSIINPQLAGASKRKSDILDAKMLAFHDLTGVWPESFIPSVDVQELRLLIAERNFYNHSATISSNRINNGILRFGYTNGRDGSVTRNKTTRAIIEDEISDSPSGSWSNICPNGIPADVREVFRSEYDLYDQFRIMQHDYDIRIINKVCSMNWETQNGLIPGIQMLDILTTAPGIGEMTACVWLSSIVTPLRFPNGKALAAYCGLDPSLKVSAGKVTSTVKRGGHRDLHSALCMAASVLIKNHKELFGQWGYNIYKHTGRWKKATNAVARKLACALYAMNLKAEAFSYDNYTLIQDSIVIDIPLEDLVIINPDYKRYVRILKANGISTTADMVDQYYACKLKSYRGLGKKFYGLIRDFITNQKQYREQYYDYCERQEQSDPMSGST